MRRNDYNKIFLIVYCAGLFELVIIYELSEHSGDIGRVVAAVILLSLIVPIAD